MSEQELIDLARESLWIALQISLPVMLVALVVGVIIGLFQALTQIQEMTLSFVPKIVAILGASFLLMPGMYLLLKNFMVRLTDLIITGGSLG